VSGPPEDMPASELWLALQHLPRPGRLVPFPGNDPTGRPLGQIFMRVLTQEELMLSASRAEGAAREMLGKAAKKEEQSIGYENLYANASAVEIVCQSCRDPADQNRPVFPGQKQARRVLTADQIAILASLYLKVQSELGPIVAHMTKEEEDAWIRRLAEGGSAFPIAALSSDMLDRLLISMASQLVAYRTDRSSAGSPQNESSSV